MPKKMPRNRRKIAGKRRKIAEKSPKNTHTPGGRRRPRALARAAVEYAAAAGGGGALVAAALGAAHAVDALGAEGDEVGHEGLGADEVDHRAGTREKLRC